MLQHMGIVTMHDIYDKTDTKAKFACRRAMRRAVRARRNSARHPGFMAPIPAGFDPELLYVECGRCGSPVLWEEGRATRLLHDAGIDPVEVDSSCILLTDGCPACGSGKEYSVRIFRLSEHGSSSFTPIHGHA